MESEIKNKVLNTGIVPLDLLDYQPKDASIGFDIADYLHLGLMLREKEFKEKLAQLDWQRYAGKSVAISCSSDAIIPSWAYMLLAVYFTGVSDRIAYCDVESLDLLRWQEAVEAIDLTAYQGKKVVVRAHPSIPAALFLSITQGLVGLASSILYGEVGLPKVISKKS